MFLKSIGVDSFFNGILFILIYNIKLSKKDKIEYYRSFILGTGVRYLYFLILTLISAILSCLLYVETDLTFFACPLFIYYFYNKLYYKRVVDIIYSKCRRTITDIVSGAIYNIIQFLCKTVLTEECSVRKEDIADFYERFGSKKLSQFGQSFAMACMYDYISVHYPYLGYVLNGYPSNSVSSNKSVEILNYEYKQRILGILNSKDWDKLFDSQTIYLFFHIYRTGNNRQIYRYIQYQLTRFHYRLLIFFSTWSILSVVDSPIVSAAMVPWLFMYIYQEDSDRRTVLYAVSPFIAYATTPVVAVFLLTIPFKFYGDTWRVLRSIPYPVHDIQWVGVCYIVYAVVGTWGMLHTRIFMTMLSVLVVRLEDALVLSFFMGVGIFSNYDLFHGLLLVGLCMGRLGLRMIV